MSDKLRPKLLPCPWCGKKGHVCRNELDVIWVECEECHCSSSSEYVEQSGDKTKQYAIENWNTRHDDKELEVYKLAFKGAALAHRNSCRYTLGCDCKNGKSENCTVGDCTDRKILSLVREKIKMQSAAEVEKEGE